MGYKALALKVMANAAIGIGLVKLWREKTQPPTVIDGEVDDDFDRWPWEHRNFHITHGMPRRFYGACGRCQDKAVVVTQ